MTEPLLVPAQEGFRRIGIARDFGYQAVREGRLRVIRVGRRILIPVRELEAFIEREAKREDAGGAA
jgi:excisionase family DNA binding protein